MRAITTKPTLLLAVLALLLVLLSRHGRSDNVVYAVGSADYTGGAVLSWLDDKGLAPEHDMKDQRKIALTSVDRHLR